MDPSFYNQLSPSEAISFQKELREKVKIQPLNTPINIIAGSDISFNTSSNIVYAGIIVLSYPALEELERVTVTSTVTFPYIPGLLAFREIPPLVDAWDKLNLKPDLLICDGHGLAHPRRVGIASHFGIIRNIPTIGCGKTRLTGKFEEPENELYAQSYLKDKQEILGIVLRTRKNCKPVFVSPGHLISVEQSAEVIKNCVAKYRVPEPTRRAHLLVNETRLKDIQF